MKQRTHDFTGALKTRVILEMLSENHSINELAKRYDLDPRTLSKWKYEFVLRSSEILENWSDREISESEKQLLYSQVS